VLEDSIGTHYGQRIGTELTIALKLCLISCATTFHSVRPPALTAVPLTTRGGISRSLLVAHSPQPRHTNFGIRWATGHEVEQAIGSFAQFKLLNFYPRQAEKSERRQLSDTKPQATFHSLAVSLAGQLGGRLSIKPISIFSMYVCMLEEGTCLGTWVCRSVTPGLTLNVDLNLLRCIPRSTV
jgi:hypothetical protein